MLAPELAPADYAVIVAYLGVMTIAGVWSGRSNRSEEGFFLGGRGLPWWALLASIVATETSAVTFLSLPGKTYATDGSFAFLQLALGYVIGRVIVAKFLLPEYFRGRIFTAYEVLQERFGPGVRLLASSVFLITRNLSDGLRLFLAALLLQAALGIGFTPCVLVIAGVTTAYAMFGGVSAVVYNDFFQFVVYMLGAMVVLGMLLAQTPDGATGLVEFAASTGRLRVFDPSWSLTAPDITLWSGLIGGAVLTIATHGADQMMVQRYLCARSERSAALALVLSGPLVLLQFALFLVIGVGLAQFYATHQVAYEVAAGDRVFLTYLVQELPTGLRGLLIAAVMAVVMSTLSSSLNSSAGVVVNDLMGDKLRRRGAAATMVAARGLTLAFAALQSTVAIVAYEGSLKSDVIDAVLAIAGFSTGLLLGLYVLGMLVGRARPLVGMIAFGGGLAVTCAAVFLSPLSWPWYCLVGSSSTLGIGLLLTGGRGHPLEEA
ncbi:Sodium/glucose cotransporter [Pirellulimonas nuda]|uniref:Sodium/glucose cotransporter n=1 Tax=Pirellulimonas nuda TaxID=2528009 RepID=A0A518DAK6_9BACT|nr:sodium/solute symporter [Pirellulimonas nuda]QDU88502.1 Sodium/glucose cotransporter [Pirellulimonas nuda]